MAVSVAAKQLKAGSVALGSLWKVVATVTQRCVLHKGSAKWLYGDRIIERTRKIFKVTLCCPTMQFTPRRGKI